MKQIRGSIYFLSLIFMCMVTQIPVSAAEQETPVKVAVFEGGNYYLEQSNGSMMGYDVEYLDKIMEKTSLKFVYVKCRNWSDALKKLSQHKVDLLGTMQWTQKREDQYEICDSYYGTTFAALAALPETGYVYEDFDAINNATIGYSKGYVRLYELKKYLKEKNLTPRLLEFQDDEALANALEDGEVNLVAANSHILKTEWKIIEKFCYSPMYFASYKGNVDLIHQINEAILKINLYESDFQNKLSTEYFPQLVEDPFTKNELEYIAKKKKITLFFQGNTPPLASWNEETEQMQGILIDACKLLSQKTGIEMQYKPVTAEKTEYGEDEFTFALSNEQNDANGKMMTESFFNCQYYLYGKSGVDYDLENTKEWRVAIPQNRQDVVDYLHKYQSEKKLIEYESPEKCMEAVETGQADFAFLNYYVANNLMVRTDRHDISLIPTTSSIFGICLGITGKDRSMLTSILNKGIGMIPEDEIEKITLDYAMNTSTNMTLRKFIQDNPKGFLCIVLAAFVFVLAMGIGVLRFSMLKRQKKILAASNEKLIRENAAKTDFLSRMSHDIRTPMNAIIGMTALAEDELDEPEQVRDYLQKIDTSSHFLLGLINDILDMSKIENDSVELHSEPYELAEFKNSVETLIRPLCEKKQIEFLFEVRNVEDDAQWILCDKLRLNQIFFNLLSNAVKYTQQGGRVEFIVEHVSTRERFIRKRFIVRDNGIGMSEEFQRHLFEPFTQEQKKQVEVQQGTGLGLAIVKNLIYMMGGTICVNSETDQGSEFIVELEVESCDAPVQMGKTVRASDEDALNGKKVLLCEDQPLNIEIAKKLLEKKGMQVVTAENGAEGVSLIKESPLYEFDVVLMDIQMPVMDGLEAARQIRAMQREDVKSLPILAMTANAYKEDVKAVMDAGMNEHLAKPINPSEVYQVLASYLQ